MNKSKPKKPLVDARFLTPKQIKKVDPKRYDKFFKKPRKMKDRKSVV